MMACTVCNSLRMKNLPDSWWNLATEVVVKCSNEKNSRHGSKLLKQVDYQRKLSRSKG